MRRDKTEEPKKNLMIVVSQKTFDWVVRTAKAEGKSRSWVVEEILLDNLPEEYQV